MANGDPKIKQPRIIPAGGAAIVVTMGQIGDGEAMRRAREMVTNAKFVESQKVKMVENFLFITRFPLSNLDMFSVKTLSINRQIN
jgi:hypothetical protein